MKKYLLILSAFLFLIESNSSYAYNLPSNDFVNYSVKSLYIKLQDKISEHYNNAISNLSTDNAKVFKEKVWKISSSFIELDNQISYENKTEVWHIITDIKSEIVSSILFLKKYSSSTIIPQEPTKDNAKISLADNVQQQDPLNNSQQTNSGDLTYYADFFEGRSTSNGNIFSHSYFSAAMCNIDLNTLIQIWKGTTSLIVKINDRPNCKKFPNIVDLTTTAFDYFSARYIGKQAGNYIELGQSPKDYYKMYFPINEFADNSIILQDKIPNSYLLNESLHINGELSLPGREITLIITSPTGKKIQLTKQVDKSFSFSFPLEELGEYTVSFDGSDENFKIYVLDDSLFNGKKLISQDVDTINNFKIIKDSLEKELNVYIIAIGGNNYNSVVIEKGYQTYNFSGIGDIIVPEEVLSDSNEVNIEISSSKTLTNFSHDFYTKPIVIFKGSVTIPK